MTDEQANLFVFGIFILVIFGILCGLNNIFDFHKFLFIIKNNSGNTSGYKLIGMACALAGIYILFYWLLRKKSSKRESLSKTRSS